MGSNDSVPCIRADRIESELSQFQSGQIMRNSLRYSFLLMCGRIIIESDYFYQNINTELIAQFIHDLGSLKIKEAKRVVKMIIQNSNSNKEAQGRINRILSRMRIATKDFRKIEYISPLHSQNLYRMVVKPYRSPWGEKFFPEKIDFKSKDILSKKAMLMKMEINKIKHTRNSALLILENPVHNLYTRDVKITQINLKKCSKPVLWIKNIHQAAFKGDIVNVSYCLSLLPALINCPDDKGNTPAHCASEGGNSKLILFLNEIGAVFNIYNDEGLLPIHLAGNQKVIYAFKSIGFDLNCRNRDGESLLEVKTKKKFDKIIIETLLNLGIDIFEPNHKGTYWMQYTIHDKYYEDIGFVKFQKFVRNILKKVKEADYLSNPIYQEIIKRDVKKCEEEDKEDLDSSITARDLSRVKVLLALGARADLIRINDYGTNLMYCAENGMTDFAEVLASNYCDPNFTDERGENTFWVASELGHYETALILRDHGADMDAISINGDTILHMAYQNAKRDLFKFLLEAGASPNIKNSQCYSVIFLAFYNRDDQIAEMLQDKYGGDINAQTVGGNTLVYLALLSQDINRMKYYIKRNADIEIKNDKGDTIFMISIINFDDLAVSKLLLDYGANIDTQDINGDTSLIRVCRMDIFHRGKFDFLLENHCNIDIQNKKREFAISVLLSRRFDEEAKVLLSMEAQINDEESEFEPIVISLQNKCLFWVETLIKNGANALNNKYSVLTSYIESHFFNFELMEQMRAWNFVIGGPLQSAMRMNYHEVCYFIWDKSTNETRIKISSSKDSNGMIPLSVAIICNNNYFIDILINKSFDVQTPDCNNMTPFIYACKVNNINVMSRIWDLIDLKNANIIDNNGYSALSYAAENNNVEFCNMMFFGNISISNIKRDSYNIIEHYQNIIEQYNRILDSTKKNLEQAKKLKNLCQNMYDNCRHEVYEMECKIKSMNSNLIYLQLEEDVDEYQWCVIREQIEEKELELKRKMRGQEQTLKKVKDSIQTFEKYRKRHQFIKERTRKEMFYDLKKFEEYGIPNKDLVL